MIPETEQEPEIPPAIAFGLQRLCRTWFAYGSCGVRQNDEKAKLANEALSDVKSAIQALLGRET